MKKTLPLGIIYVCADQEQRRYRCLHSPTPSLTSIVSSSTTHQPDFFPAQNHHLVLSQNLIWRERCQWTQLTWEATGVYESVWHCFCFCYIWEVCFDWSSLRRYVGGGDALWAEIRMRRGGCGGSVLQQKSLWGAWSSEWALPINGGCRISVEGQWTFHQGQKKNPAWQHYNNGQIHVKIAAYNWKSIQTQLSIEVHTIFLPNLEVRAWVRIILTRLF